ncbi:hypothetical protein DLAC_05567 [Tieghemostelium lacteum]|uniref:Leucine-rich repeat-containing protein (LRR) n=1 Tax=Tieghemostelium lacteum TaxID=361077 RepID=A0A151ZG65_TIELA|nr:hypothetical protein DLAC_05567 [Tieghemostelium lacteum]|eukprot:KYQ92966.1 hypothetical protein DLAC_05567 [Tieghemostelium lacteum]
MHLGLVNKALFEYLHKHYFKFISVWDLMKNNGNIREAVEHLRSPYCLLGLPSSLIISNMAVNNMAGLTFVKGLSTLFVHVESLDIHYNQLSHNLLSVKNFPVLKTLKLNSVGINGLLPPFQSTMVIPNLEHLTLTLDNRDHVDTFKVLLLAVEKSITSFHLEFKKPNTTSLINFHHPTSKLTSIDFLSTYAPNRLERLKFISDDYTMDPRIINNQVESLKNLTISYISSSVFLMFDSLTNLSTLTLKVHAYQELNELFPLLNKYENIKTLDLYWITDENYFARWIFLKHITSFTIHAFQGCIESYLHLNNKSESLVNLRIDNLTLSEECSLSTSTNFKAMLTDCKSLRILTMNITRYELYGSLGWCFSKAISQSKSLEQLHLITPDYLSQENSIEKLFSHLPEGAPKLLGISIEYSVPSPDKDMKIIKNFGQYNLTCEHIPNLQNPKVKRVAYYKNGIPPNYNPIFNNNVIIRESKKKKKVIIKIN